MASKRSQRRAEQAPQAARRGAQPTPEGREPAETTEEHASVSQQAAALSKTGDSYHGGVTRREALALRLQRRMGNRHAQRVVGQARGQDDNRASAELAHLPQRGAALVQRLEGSQQLADGSTLEVKMPAIEGEVPPEAAHMGKHWGLHGTVTFTPSDKSALSNKINFIQTANTTALASGDPVATGALPADRRKQVDTVADAAAGVTAGAHTDVYHNQKNKGDALHPSYAYQPVYGYHRSNEPGDIKAAQLTDTPGLSGDTGSFRWSFETVARGDDNMVDYGTARWGFVVDNGKVGSETLSFQEGSSATFKAALDKHRDFYVHEPVTFYFGFDQNAPLAGEADKIDRFLDYLNRNPDVQLEIKGFADQRGDPDYNMGLGLRRCEAIEQALLGKGIAQDRISNILVSLGETTQFTDDKAPADQDREALRRWNRRVTVTFKHTSP